MFFVYLYSPLYQIDDLQMFPPTLRAEFSLLRVDFVLGCVELWPLSPLRGLRAASSPEGCAEEWTSESHPGQRALASRHVQKSVARPHVPGRGLEREQQRSLLPRQQDRS